MITIYNISANENLIFFKSIQFFTIIRTIKVTFYFKLFLLLLIFCLALSISLILVRIQNSLNRFVITLDVYLLVIIKNSDQIKFKFIPIHSQKLIHLILTNN
jgi:hypothetical protein